MDEFALEVFAPANGTPTADAARLAALAQLLRDEGDDVRYLHTLYLPDEETSFHVFAAASAAVLERLQLRAGLVRARVVSASSTIASSSEML